MFFRTAIRSTRVPQPRQGWSGFTLSELLVCLLILGEISAMTIPKVLMAQQNQQKQAILKETIGTLSQLTYLGQQDQSLNYTTTGYTYFSTRMNAVKLCPNNATTEGCWSASQADPSGFEATQPGMVLHNGATIVGIDNTVSPLNGLVLDYNGPSGPNVEGVDQIYLGYNANANGNLYVVPAGSIRAGTVGPYSVASIAFFNSLFQ